MNQKNRFFCNIVTTVKPPCTCQLLRLLPGRHVVSLIMELIGNCSFTLTTGNNKQNRLRRLLNGRPSGIHPVSPSLQHLHLWPANHRLEKVCIRQRPSNHVYWWRLTNSGRGNQQRHSNCRWLPPDLEVKAQYYKICVGSLPPQKQGS